MPDDPDTTPDRTVDGSTTPDDAETFRSAEEWLAARGVQRDPIRVAPKPESTSSASDKASGPAPGQAPGPPPSAREARRLAEASARDAHLTHDEAGQDDQHGVEANQGAEADPTRPRLEDQVSEAVAFARRSTSRAPQSEQRLRSKLAGRGIPDVAIDLALERCRDQGIVDDESMARALLEEGRAKGHAPLRLRTDLERRGFDRLLIDRLLAPVQEQDQEAAAFDVAARKARSMGDVDNDTAFRRLVGHLARRGYTEGLSRKVARQVVFADRSDRQAAER